MVVPGRTKTCLGSLQRHRGRVLRFAGVWKLERSGTISSLSASSVSEGKTNILVKANLKLMLKRNSNKIISIHLNIIHCIMFKCNYNKHVAKLIQRQQQLIQHFVFATQNILRAFLIQKNYSYFKNI